MTDVEDLLLSAGAQWRAAQSQPPRVIIPPPRAEVAHQWARSRRVWLTSLVVALSVVVAVWMTGTNRSSTDNSVASDPGSAIGCTARELEGAAAATDRTYREGFRSAELERARLEGSFLAEVATRAIGQLESAAADARVGRLRRIAEVYRREATTLLSVGNATAGVDPGAANTARQAIRAAAQEIRILGYTDSATPDCAVAVIPPALQSQPAAPPPPATAMPVQDGVAVEPVPWSSLPTPEVLRDMARVTDEFGWVKTSIDLRLTEDGGRTWRLSMPPNLQPDPVYTAVVFRSPTDGWVLGLSASGSGLNAYRTTDGGRSWAAIRPPWSNADETSVPPYLHIVGGALVAVDHEGAEFVSVDGGDTWAKGFPVEDASRYAQLDITLKTGTKNGTDTLEAVLRVPPASDVTGTLPEPAAYEGTERWPSPVASRMFGPTRGLAIVSWIGGRQAPRAVVYRTVDGGRTWSIVSDVETDARSASLFDMNTWTIVGDGDAIADSSTLQVWSTADGGATWHESSTRYKGAVQMWGSWLDPKHGWVIANIHCEDACQHGYEPGKSNVVMATENGGASWAVITPPR